jgi:excisionase family DNA binding protein
MDNLDAIVQFNLFSLGLAMLTTARTINKDAVYTMSEAAFLVNCEYKSIFHAIQNNHLKAGGIGRTPRVKGSDLLAWIEAGGRTGRRGLAPL